MIQGRKTSTSSALVKHTVYFDRSCAPGHQTRCDMQLQLGPPDIADDDEILTSECPSILDTLPGFENDCEFNCLPLLQSESLKSNLTAKCDNALRRCESEPFELLSPPSKRCKISSHLSCYETADQNYCTTPQTAGIQQGLPTVQGHVVRSVRAAVIAEMLDFCTEADIRRGNVSTVLGLPGNRNSQ